MQPGLDVRDRRIQALACRGCGVAVLGAGTPLLGASGLLAAPVPPGRGVGVTSFLEEGPAETCSWGPSLLPAPPPRGQHPETCWGWEANPNALSFHVSEPEPELA